MISCEQESKSWENDLQREHAEGGILLMARDLNEAVNCAEDSGQTDSYSLRLWFYYECWQVLFLHSLSFHIRRCTSVQIQQDSLYYMA